MSVSLREITQDNVRAVCELQTTEEQRRMVAPAAYTIAEAAYEDGGILRAIYLDEAPVGLVFVALDSATPHIVRLMVDRAFQRRGVGRDAIELLLAELREDGHEAVETSYAPIENGAEGFWSRMGFEPTGRESCGEPVVRRALAP